MLAVSMSPPVAHYPAVQRRPKLSLQTSELPITYSASSRGLSTIATPSAAATPTTLNTFNNTFDLTHRPSPTATTASPSILRSTPGQDRISGSQSPRPKHPEPAYVINLPYGIKPILKNTSFPGVRNSSISASPRSSTRRVFFPAPKEVVFKHAIEEEIVTKIYTARHSDLFQPDEADDDQVPEETAPPEISVSSNLTEDGSSISISSSTRRPLHLDTPEDDDPTEPISGRIDTDSVQVSTPAGTKKRRKWEWTLAPLPQSCNRATVAEPSPPPPEAKSGSEHASIQSASKAESERKPLRSSSPLRQASAICGDRDSESAPPHRNFHATSSVPKMSSSPCLTKLKIALPLPPSQSPSHKQRRGGSLDSSPSRKRKAECLDASAITPNDASGVGCSDGEIESESDSEGSTGTGQTSGKRRERAATL